VNFEFSLKFGKIYFWTDKVDLSLACSTFNKCCIKFLLDGGGSNSGQQGSGRLNDHRQQQPSGSSNNNNGNSSAKDCSEFLLTSTDDDVFDDEEFLTSPSPTTPTDKTRRSKERIRRPMNAFMVKTLFRRKKYEKNENILNR
jgi:hypothetical protein